MTAPAGQLDVNGQPEAVYTYSDERGDTLFQVVRFPEKQFAQRRPDGSNGWIWNLDGVRRVLYRLNEVVLAQQVVLVEGEKDVETLRQLEIVATTNPGGAGSWQDKYAEFLRGKHVVIIPDADDSGWKWCKRAASSLLNLAASIRVVILPGIESGSGGDVSDWLMAGHARNELLELIESAEVLKVAPATPKGDKAEKKPRKKSQASIVVKAFEAEFCSGESTRHDQLNAPLFHTPGGVAYASIFINGHRETHALKSQGFRALLSHAYYKKHHVAPSSETIRSAIAVLEGKALFEGPEITVHVRVAEKEGSIYLDLADPQWRAVRITASGYEIVSDPPVRFRRARGMLSLPVPVSGGDPQELLAFLNVRKRSDQLLVLTWTTAAFLPKGPYPILILHGGQGSAKSTLGAIIRRLLDPSEAPLRTSPRDDRDMMIAASNSYVLVFDNLSGIPPWFSDALCRVASGGGLATRELYTDNEEVIFAAQRPIILNGIEEVSARGDLLDRMILVELPPILKTCRRDEENFWREFEAARPRIFGALLSAVSKVLGGLPAVKLMALPRMADFARVGVAAEQALGFESEEFMAAYDENVAEANRTALESSVVALAILDFLKTDTSWEGTAGELLGSLTKTQPENIVKEKHWPKTPRGLTNAIARVEPNLAVEGVIISRWREGHSRTRKIRVERVGKQPSAQSAPSASDSFERFTEDEAADGARPGREVPSAVPSAIKSSLFNWADDADGADGQNTPLLIGEPRGMHPECEPDPTEGDL